MPSALQNLSTVWVWFGGFFGFFLEGVGGMGGGWALEGVCLFVCLFYPYWSVFNWETSVYGNLSKVIKTKCSAEEKPTPWDTHFHREALVSWRKRNRRGFASSVAGYFAHAALFKPTGLQQSSQGFVFVYTTPSAQKKWTAHKRAGSEGASTFWRWKHWSWAALSFEHSELWNPTCYFR